MERAFFFDGAPNRSTPFFFFVRKKKFTQISQQLLKRKYVFRDDQETENSISRDRWCLEQRDDDALVVVDFFFFVVFSDVVVFFPLFGDV